MRVFLDTNVLVSAFATRGLCADLLQHILAEHELIVGEVVIKELTRVLRDRFRVPAETIKAIVSMLRKHVIIPIPKAIKEHLPERDKDDQWVLESAIAGRADVLVTGDRDLLEIAAQVEIDILSPREFWERLTAK